MGLTGLMYLITPGFPREMHTSFAFWTEESRPGISQVGFYGAAHTRSETAKTNTESRNFYRGFTSTGIW